MVMVMVTVTGLMIHNQSKQRAQLHTKLQRKFDA
jgi:hypothetical protein